MRAAFSSTLVLLACLSAIADEPKNDGFTPLFNGKDLTGWKAYDTKGENWLVEDGLLVCNGKGAGWLGTDRDYADFILRLEYRLKPGGNSGVYLRAPEKGHISRVGMEIQILDDHDPRYANIDYYQYTGALYHVAAPTRRASKQAGEWNAMELRALGRQLIVLVNGKKVVDVDLDHCRKDAAVAKEHPGLARTSGRIGLQSHTDRVEFRNIYVKEPKTLEPKPSDR